MSGTGSSGQKSDSVNKVTEITQSSNNSVSDMDVDKKKCNIKAFQWFYEREFENFFQFVEAKNNNSVLVRCLQCPPTKKTLNVTANSAFNLNSHFKVSFRRT